MRNELNQTIFDYFPLRLVEIEVYKLFILDLLDTVDQHWRMSHILDFIQLSEQFIDSIDRLDLLIYLFLFLLSISVYFICYRLLLSLVYTISMAVFGGQSG